MSKITEIPESIYGVYVWQMPNGQVVGDDEGRFLSIEAKFGDVNRIKKLKDAVRQFGIEEGEPKFLSAHRKVSDTEYDDQVERQDKGLIPDPYDPGNVDG